MKGSAVLSLSLSCLHVHSFPGEGAVSIYSEGVPHPAASVGRDGEAHLYFLPSLGAGKSHYLCCERPRNTGPDSEQTQVAG